MKVAALNFISVLALTGFFTPSSPFSPTDSAMQTDIAHKASAMSPVTAVSAAPVTVPLSGEVKSVGRGTLSLASDEGEKSWSVTVSSSAEITRNGQSAALSDVIPGDLARITALKMNDEASPVTQVVHATGLQSASL